MEKANVTYQIFDSPTMDGGFEDRMKQIRALITHFCKKNQVSVHLRLLCKKK